MEGVIEIHPTNDISVNGEDISVGMLIEKIEEYFERKVIYDDENNCYNIVVSGSADAVSVIEYLDRINNVNYKVV